MNRAGFLRGTLGLVAGLAFGRLPEVTSAAPVVEATTVPVDESWVFLDGGSLELGIVRDSVLNSTNDFQIFAEVFEKTQFVGRESAWVTSA